MFIRSVFTAVLAAASVFPVAVPALAREPIPVEDFFRLSSFSSAVISPDGRHLAALVPLEDKTALVVMDIATKKITATHKPQDKVHVQNYFWVNDTRLMYSIAYKAGQYAVPANYGGMYAINADGTQRGTLYAQGESIRLLDTLDDDDRFVLVQTYDSKGASLARMDVYNGHVTPMFKRAPSIAGIGSFVVDNGHEPRLYVTGRNMNDITYYIRKGEAWDWEVFYESKLTGLNINPMGFSADNSILYYSAEEAEGPNSLMSYDIASGDRRLVARDDNVNPAALLKSPVDDAVYGVAYNDGFRRYEWLDKKNMFAADLMSLQLAFPGADVSRSSTTKDGRVSIYAVSSDTLPGELYLFDHVTKKAEHLLSAMSWLDQNAMSLMEPMKFKARDGLELEVFLTLPKGSSGKGLPMIVHPHGGPFGPFDRWGFQPEIQLLANRGYAVLQVNFRGSGNYGRAFQAKGYKEWGKAMQDDLTDATRWAIAQGIADSNRICIYGASYGGYAALMGAAKEPALYKCAVGNVGVYDLPDMVAEDAGYGGMMNPLKVYFKETANPEDVSSSPTRVAGQIKVPVYLMAGSKDTTCPPEWTKKMHRALQSANVPVQMHIYEGEMHGNSLVSNQIDFAKRLVAFFDEHIGGK